MAHTSEESDEELLNADDLSISYDKWVWIMGYESADSSQPPSGDQMLENVMRGQNMKTKLTI